MNDARRIFGESLERPRAERVAYIEEAAGDDGALRAKILDLVRAHDEAAEFLLSALDDEAPTDAFDASDAPGESSPDSLDRYTLLDRLGEGGMGEVWRAAQHEPVQREVAVKIIKLGMDTRDVVARFEAERQALARMDHPNIAKVFDAGVTATGRPYFVMELARGVPISRYCEEGRRSIEDRVRLFQRTCDAIQHAHHKGVIHRDIKPSNVLVVEVDGVPVPKVIDFGIAKATDQRLTDQALRTQHQQLLGTPQSMSPEQASAGATDVDARTDIYSLGVLLYELLTGTHPFRGGDSPSESSVEEILLAVREVDPEPPSVRASALRGDLDWIVMRAMEKDRDRRYPSASALAADLERHLVGEPVEASPPSAVYRISKYVRRHRVAVVAGGLVAISLLIALIAGVVGFRGVQRESEKAKIERDNARETLDFVQMMLRPLEPAVARGEVITLRAAVDQWATFIEESGEDRRPEVRAALGDLVGFAYLVLDEMDLALRHHRTAYDIRREVLGPDHPDTLNSGHNLASALLNTHQYAAAEAILQETLRRRRAVLGEHHAGTIRTMSNLAEVFGQTERWTMAVAFKRTALSLLEEHHSADMKTIARVRHNLAMALVERSEYEEAEPMLREALADQMRLLGEDHPETLHSRKSLASLLGRTHRVNEALTLIEDVLVTCRRVFGDEHRQTLDALDSLGVFSKRVGRYHVLERSAREALEVRTRTLGLDNERTIIAEANLGVALSLRKEYAEAEAVLRAAHDRASRFHEGHHARNYLDMELARVLVRTGRFEEAEPLLRRARQGAERLLGPIDDTTWSATHGLVELLAATERSAEGTALFLETLDACRAELDDDDPRSLTLHDEIGWWMHHLLEDSAKAEPLLRHALAGRRRVSGDDAEATMLTMNRLAALCWATGQSDEALALTREVIEHRRRVLGPTHRSTLGALNNLGWWQRSAESLEAAERSLWEAASGYHAEWAGDPGALTIVKNHLRVAIALEKEQADSLGADHATTRGTRRRVAEGRLNAAEFLVREERVDTAIRVLRSGLEDAEVDPEFDDVRLAAARALLSTLEESGEN